MPDSDSWTTQMGRQWQFITMRVVGGRQIYRITITRLVAKCNDLLLVPKCNVSLRGNHIGIVAGGAECVERLKNIALKTNFFTYRKTELTSFRLPVADSSCPKDVVLAPLLKKYMSI